MPAVLTAGSTVVCAHQGTVTLVAGQNKLTVGGQAALVQGDLDGKAIAGCVTVTDPNTSTLLCSTVAAALGGVSTRLTVGGKGVLLDTIQGQTNGTVGGVVQTWSVQDAGQTRLTTAS